MVRGTGTSTQPNMIWPGIQIILAMDPFCLLFSLPFILATHALENGDRRMNEPSEGTEKVQLKKKRS